MIASTKLGRPKSLLRPQHQPVAAAAQPRKGCQGTPPQRGDSPVQASGYMVLGPGFPVEKAQTLRFQVGLGTDLNPIHRNWGRARGTGLGWD